MSDVELTLLTGIVVLLVAAVWIIHALHAIHHKILGLKSNMHEIIVDPSIVDRWKQQLREVEKFSPKWKAYYNRLVEVGEIGGDRL